MLGPERTGNNGAKETDKGISEVSRKLGITKKMLWDWKTNEAKIVASKVGSRTVTRQRKGKWDDMERELYDRFSEVRGIYYLLN